MEIPDVLIGCGDVKCQSDDHIKSIDFYVDNFYTYIEETAKETLPTQEGTSNSHDKENVVGWNNEN